MKKLTHVFTVIGLSLAVSITPGYAKDKDQQKDGPPGLQKKGGVPPGLQKKGGVPPGQAKKQGRSVADDHEVDQADEAVKKTTKEATPQAPEQAEKKTAPISREPSTEPKQPQSPAPAVQKPEPTAKTNPTQPVSNVNKETQQRRDRLHQNLEAINAQAANPETRKDLIRRISKRNDVKVSKLEAQLKAHPTLGPADLYVAHEIARESKKPVERIITQHESGKTWGELANEHRAGLQDLVKHSGELKSGLERSGKKSASN